MSWPIDRLRLTAAVVACATSLAFPAGRVAAQQCDAPPLEGDLQLFSQADVNGLAGGPAWVMGSVTVSGTDIVDLRAMSCLERVDGTLEIQFNAALTQLSGLEKVSWVGSLVVESNGELTEVRLPGLGVVTGSLRIEANAEVTRIDLPTLREAGTVTVQSNPTLARLDLWERLTLTRSFRVIGNAALEAIALPELREAENAASLLDNAALESVALPNLGWTEDLRVSGSPALASLQAPKLDSVWSLTLAGTQALTSLSLPSLSLVDSYINVTGNRGLTSLTFAERARLGDNASVILADNALLTGFPLAFAPQLWSVSIRGNARLASLDGTRSLQRLLDGLDVDGNNNLGALTLTRLEEVGAGFIVQRNPSMTRLDLPALHTVGGEFVIFADVALAGLDLRALRRVDGGITLSSNRRLERVMWQALESSGPHFRVGRHPLLSSCAQVEDAARLGLASQGTSIEIGSNDDAGFVPMIVSITPSELPEWAGTRCALGVTITGGTYPDLAPLSDLRSVGIAVLVDGGDVSELVLPDLRHVGQYLTVRNSEGPEKLSFPELRTVGSLEVSAVDDVLEVSAEQLARVYGFLFLDHNPGLSGFSFTALRRAASIAIWCNPNLPVASVTQLVARVEPLASASGGNLGEPENPVLPC